mmetsp:Transcript_46571/g.97858  ORF Transcript_46571/g.97858 Transcript_46571/m.97858 type:complete len:427 (+) Transcript_46571:179-1459(+)
MFQNILLVLSAAAAAASQYDGHDGPTPPLAHHLDASYTFEHYLAHFSKSYNDPDEYTRRSKLFAANLETILSHNEGKMNEDGDLIKGGYVMGVNTFTDFDTDELYFGYNKAMHPEWSSQLNGGASKTERRLGKIDTKSYSKPPDFHMDEVSQLPESIDWEAEGKINPTVPNQGGCGSCWTFAATGAVEAQYAINTGEDPPTLSEEIMLSCTPNPDQCGGQGGCSGATVELAYNYIADQTAKKTGGMFTLDDVPYEPKQGAPTGDDCVGLTTDKTATVGIDGWTSLKTNDYKAVMNAVVKVGPLAVAVAASKWALYEKGVIDQNESTVNHAVLLVGYGVDEDSGEKFFKIRNSWGPGFGENGYIRIKRTDDDGNECQTDEDPLVGLACALDDNGNKLDVKPVKVCGTDGVLFDAVYPTGANKIESFN